ELADSWCRVPALASGEWISAAAYAAALAGRDGAVRVRDMLTPVEHHTPWTRAALRTVDAALADADQDHAGAGRLHVEAARIYARIPDQTDRIIALALAASAQQRAADWGAAEAILNEVRKFALCNRAPGLLRLAGEHGHRLAV
ncbi:MAG TPA: adenylyl cyclase, partial [Micromonospora sp.]|nr:adenylyl cyclase [Micromonospora sp.]